MISEMLDSSALQTVVTKFYCPLAATLCVRNRCLLNDIVEQIVNLLLLYLTYTPWRYIMQIPLGGIYETER